MSVPLSYALCKKEQHYVRARAGSACPVVGCDARVGRAIAVDEPDPRGSDPFFYGKTARQIAEAKARETYPPEDGWYYYMHEEAPLHFMASPEPLDRCWHAVDGGRRVCERAIQLVAPGP